jgi:hypothetical protein
MSKIVLDTNIDLGTVEAALAAASGSDVELWLSRNTRASFFVESRVVALLCTLARRGRLQIVDRGIDSFDRTYYSTDLVRLGVLQYATTVRSRTQHDITTEVRDAKDSIERSGGVVETPEPSRTVSFCAFDTEARRQPLALSTVTTKSQFRADFVRRLRTAFQLAEPTADLFRNDYENVLADLVFELWENGVQHGCRGEGSGVLPGLRLMHIRRHIAPSLQALKARAEGFPELVAFFDGRAGRRTHRFFEVSISDQGLGIVDRFLASRQDVAQSALGHLTPRQLLIEIMKRALSSKLYQPGAGHGLRKALDAVHGLNGFLSLRFGNEWMYSSCAEPLTSGELASVSRSSELHRISGTHFNILVEAP